MTRSESTSFALGLSAALFWGPHFGMVVKAMDQDVPLLVFYFYVVLWAAAACAVVLAAMGRLQDLSVFHRRETTFFLLTLTGGYGLWLFRALALERAGSNLSNLRIWLYSGPLMLGLLSMPSREGARGRQILALLLGFVGCIMISVSPSGEESAGGSGAWLLALGGAACWAVFALLARPLVRQEKALPTGAVIWGMGAACLLVTLLVTGESKSLLAITPRGLWLSMIIGAGTVALGFGCWLKCLAGAAPAFVAPLWYLSLVFGIVWGTSIGGPSSRWWLAGGAALILVAVYAACSGRSRPTMTMSDVIRG